MLRMDNIVELDLLLKNWDGVPLDYVGSVWQFLNNNFLGQWIGRRGPIEWPPRTPDLTPLDVFLMGMIKI